MAKDERPDLLLEAVLALTQPVRRKVIQEDLSRPSGTKTTTIELPSLLEQMDAAIRGTMGGAGGTLPSERNLLDSDALFKMIKISSTVADWARAVGAAVHRRDAGRTLKGWYITYSQGQTRLEADRFHIKKLTGWAVQIEAKLDPPRIKDLPDPCPVCGASTWWLASTRSEYPRPLVIEYRPTGPDMIREARALCRACEHVWGVRELAWELEQQHAAQTGTTGL